MIGSFVKARIFETYSSGQRVEILRVSLYIYCGEHSSEQFCYKIDFAFRADDYSNLSQPRNPTASKIPRQFFMKNMKSKHVKWILAEKSKKPKNNKNCENLAKSALN